MERKDICDAMIFALDNADSAFEVQTCFLSAQRLFVQTISTPQARQHLVACTDMLPLAASRFPGHMFALLHKNCFLNLYQLSY